MVPVAVVVLEVVVAVPRVVVVVLCVKELEVDVVEVSDVVVVTDMVAVDENVLVLDVVVDSVLEVVEVSVELRVVVELEVEVAEVVDEDVREDVVDVLVEQNPHRLSQSPARPQVGQKITPHKSKEGIEHIGQALFAFSHHTSACTFCE